MNASQHPSSSAPQHPGSSAPRHILVTGGAGFIGANLVRLLLNEGYHVRVLDNFSTGRREYLDGPDLEIIEGDILDTKTVAEAVAGMDSVVHLAAQTGVPGSLADPFHDCETNVIGTLNLLEACRRASTQPAPAECAAPPAGRIEAKQPDQTRSLGFDTLSAPHRATQPAAASLDSTLVRHPPRTPAPLLPRFVFASSNAPLGRQPPPATEEKAPLPIAPYGASKLAGEGYCLAYHGSWGLGTVVLRFANVYGPFSSHKSSVVAKFFKDILSGGELTIDGDGRQTRDFIYVEDLCRAILLALEADVSGEVFQIATGEETSILELAELVQEVTGRSVEAHHGPARQGDIRKSYSAVTKAQRMLGWEPRMALKAGLRTTWKWFQAEDGNQTVD